MCQNLLLLLNQLLFHNYRDLVKLSQEEMIFRIRKIVSHLYVIYLSITFSFINCYRTVKEIISTFPLNIQFITFFLFYPKLCWICVLQFFFVNHFNNYSTTISTQKLSLDQFGTWSDINTNLKFITYELIHSNIKIDVCGSVNIKKTSF